ncbi:hypothetical protein QJQ45_027581 [Haematococcus lacustris]|nr:hypothetical protein QJQ45_015671 [Haematococcus lacustris]KAJ9510788.1 hypothetical protein QJQ45_027581 [Haematococcus lacustris]
MAPQQAPKVPEKMEIPKDQNPVEQAASPVATLSAHVDPIPQYTAAAACAGTAGYMYSKQANPRAALAAAGFSLLYFTAGRLVVTGNPTTGYDLGSATSLGLLAWAAPGAAASGANSTLAAVGGLSSVANLIKSWQYRTGKPHEMVEK